MDVLQRGPGAVSRLEAHPSPCNGAGGRIEDRSPDPRSVAQSGNRERDRPHPDPSISMKTNVDQPVIGITCGLVEDQVRLRRTHVRAVTDRGGVVVALPPLPGTGARVLEHLDGLVLSGGDDPDTRPFGAEVHPKATLIDPDRQAFELELLDYLRTEDPDMPILGICLGMQLLGLHGGGCLDQHLPDTLETADQHWNGGLHDVEGPLFNGRVYSHHRQALSDPGDLEVVASAPDGVVEAIRCPARHHVEGVQWHPERTDHEEVGTEVFARLIGAARNRAR